VLLTVASRDTLTPLATIACASTRGTPAEFWITVFDPTTNIFAGSPYAPSWGGSYPARVDVAVAGRHYQIGGYLEVNFDFLHGYYDGDRVFGDWRGNVMFREGFHTGPDLFGVPLVGCWIAPYGSCRYDILGYTADPTSAAIPAPPETLQVPIRGFAGTPLLWITGGNPQVVPEPLTLLLVATGFGAVAVRHRQRFLKGR
jgi:hypothetical protein